MEREPYKHVKKRTSVEDRETIEVGGQKLRLIEVAQQCPEVLARRIADGDSRTGAYWSVLNKVGLTRTEVYKRCEEWGIDLGVITQMW